MALSEDEQRDWKDRYRAEVAEEHKRRQELASRAETTRQHRSELDAMEREAELARIRAEVREQYWKDLGYMRYVDSRGVEVWLPPEEYEKRMERRKRRKKPLVEPQWGNELKRVGMFVGVLVLAVILGLALGSG